MVLALEITYKIVYEIAKKYAIDIYLSIKKIFVYCKILENLFCNKFIKDYGDDNKLEWAINVGI